MVTRFPKITVFSIRLLLICALVLTFILPALSSSYSTSQNPECRVTLLKNRDYFPVLIKAIDGAGTEIVMSFFLFKTNGYPKNCPDIVVAHLIDAARRGVTVKVILETGRDLNLNKNNRETGIILKNGGVDVYFDHPTIKTHTKVVVIDKRYTFLGSHNLTNSALKYNNELSILIDSPKAALETLSYIDSVYK